MELVDDILDLIDILADLFSCFLDLGEFSDDILGKQFLLSLNVFMSHRAEVEQVEDIDLEYLEVRDLVKSILKF